MSTGKHIDKICIISTALALVVSIVLMCFGNTGASAAVKTIGYENRLFSTDKVHTIDIVLDDKDSFFQNAMSEEYTPAAVVIDGEGFRNIAIRAKGNTSLSSVSAYGNDRYSLKIEFDHYDSAKTYHGLDKMCLNNIIQDNTYMKDYLVYNMMAEYGVDAPLCSFAYITINGEDFGLYLAVESIEDSFMARYYGSEGNLYKPDSMSMGGGRGKGKDFSMDDFDFGGAKDFTNENGISAFPDISNEDIKEFAEKNGIAIPDGSDPGSRGASAMLGNADIPPEKPDEGTASAGGKGGMNFGFGGMGSNDVKLQYIDDDPDSYSNIFDSAKTEINKSDKTRLIASLKKLSGNEDIENVVDVDEVLRYWVVHNYSVNGDSYIGSMIHNYYLYENDGRFAMIPWDYNLAFGGFMGGNADSVVNDDIDSPLSTGSDSRPMWDWVFSSDEYKEMYHSYFAEFLDRVGIENIIVNAYSLIKDYVEKDPTKFCTFDEFEKGVETLREFCRLRTESIKNQLDGNNIRADAGGITISDMGSMGSGKGGFGGVRPEMPGGNTVSSEPSIAGNTEATAKVYSAGDFTPPQMQGGQIPQLPNGEILDFPNGEMPRMPDGQMPEPPDGIDIPSIPDGQTLSAPQNNEAPSETVTTTEVSSETINAGGTEETAKGANETAQQDPQTDGNRVPKDKMLDAFNGIPGNTANKISESVILLAVSVIVLAAGLVFAVKFRR